MLFNIVICIVSGALSTAEILHYLNLRDLYPGVATLFTFVYNPKFSRDAVLTKQNGPGQGFSYLVTGDWFPGLYADQ